MKLRYRSFALRELPLGARQHKSYTVVASERLRLKFSVKRRRLAPVTGIERAPFGVNLSGNTDIFIRLILMYGAFCFKFHFIRREIYVKGA